MESLNNYIRILLISTLLTSPFFLYSQSPSLRFNHYSLEDGLSQNTIEDVAQDNKGFIWFATQDGLNRFDGYRFRTFVNQKNDPNSLSLNWVYSLHYNEEMACMWIGTAGRGLDRFDLETETFSHYPLPEANQSHPGSIYDIHEDGKGILWLGTDQGLFRFDPSTTKYTKIKHSKTSTYLTDEDHVLKVVQDKKGLLWLGTRNGLLCYNIEKQEFTKHFESTTNNGPLSHKQVLTLHYFSTHQELWIGTYDGLDILNLADSSFQHYKANELDTSIPDNRIQEIYEDRNGDIWLGTYKGLSIVHREQGHGLHFHNYFAGNASKFQLSNDRISTIFEDKTATVWIGTYFGGINKYDLSANRFQVFTAEAPKDYALSDNIIRSVVKDTTGTIWVGTNTGLNRIDPISKKITTYHKNSSSTSGLKSNLIRSLALSKHNKLWIGTGEEGLHFLDFKSNTIRYLPIIDASGHPLLHADIRALAEDDNNTLWVGTNLNGLFKYNILTKQWTQYQPEANYSDAISSNQVTSILVENSSRIWIGTWKGLNYLDVALDKFHNFTKEQYPSLTSNFIKSIWKDNQGRIWVGTAGVGLDVLIDINTGKFQSYTSAEGLPNNFIYSILGDDTGNLWVSTNRGLSKFSSAWSSFRNYDVRDGLQGYEFNTGAYHRAFDGELFFGGINGLNSFYPDSLVDNPVLPLPIITNIKLFHRTIPIAENSHDTLFSIKKASPYLDELRLDYDQNVITFEYTAMHYADLSKNSYQYQLVGFDNDWVDAEKNEHAVTYTSLAPGTYTFKVRATNNDGLWGKQEAKIQLIINPPFWLTTWFIALVILAIIGLFVLIYNWRLSRIKERTALLERSVAERTNEIAMQNEELSQSRDELKAINDNLAVTKVQLEKSLRTEQASVEKLEHVNKQLAEREQKLIESEEQLRQHSEELQITNENLQLMTKYLEKSAEREKRDRLEIQSSHDELKRTQNQLIASEKLAALGELVASVAHEVNTPLGAIKSSIGTVSLSLSSAFPQFMNFISQLSEDDQLLFFQLLDTGLQARKLSSKESRTIRKELAQELEIEELPSSRIFVQQLVAIGVYARFKEFVPLLKHRLAPKMIAAVEQLTRIQSGLSTIQLATDKASKIIYALKNYARFDKTGNMSMGLIQDGIDTSLILYNNYLRHSVTVVKELDDLPPIACYPDELNQVWVNLIYNGLQAMDFQGQLEIRLTQEDHFAKVTVADSGMGIPEKVRSRIFEPFFTTKPKGEGSGLGLSIVKQIVEKHNGQIDFVTEMGKGTIFTVLIPIQSELTTEDEINLI